jgi:nicotinamidase-related amidase
VPDRHTKPLFESAALITIDTQCDVLEGGTFPVPGTAEALPNMRRLLDIFRASARPIVHVVRIYEPDGSNAEPCRRELLASGVQAIVRGTEGCELAPALRPHKHAYLDPDLLLAGGIQHLAANEVVIYKPRWGAFYRTPLDEHLHDNGITTLIFTGCNFPNCPRTSIYEASERDFRIVVVTDALSGLYDRGERELEGIGVNLMSAEEVVQSTRQGQPEPHDRQRGHEDRGVEHVPFGAAHVRADQ